jgi:hypothetical protein
VTYTALCTECEWTFEHGRKDPVAERLEEHARRQDHEVEFTRRAFEAPV